MLPGPTVGRGRETVRASTGRPRPAASASRVLGRAALPARVRVVIGQAGSPRRFRPDGPHPDFETAARRSRRRNSPRPPARVAGRRRVDARGHPDPTAPRAPARSRRFGEGPRYGEGPRHGAGRARGAARASEANRKAASNATARMRPGDSGGPLTGRPIRPASGFRRLADGPSDRARRLRLGSASRGRPGPGFGGDQPDAIDASGPEVEEIGEAGREGLRGAGRLRARRGFRLPGVRPVPAQLGRLHGPTIALAPAGSAINVPSGRRRGRRPVVRGRPQVRRRPTFSARTRSWSPAVIRSRRRSLPIARPIRLLVVPQRRQALEKLVLHADQPAHPDRRGRGRDTHLAGRLRRPPGDRSRHRPTSVRRPRRHPGPGDRAEAEATVRPGPRFSRGSPELRLAAADRGGLRGSRRRLSRPSPGASVRGGGEGIGWRGRAPPARAGRGPGRSPDRPARARPADHRYRRRRVA